MEVVVDELLDVVRGRMTLQVYQAFKMARQFECPYDDTPPDQGLVQLFLLKIQISQQEQRHGNDP